MKKLLLASILLPAFLFAQKDSINMDAKLNFFTPVDVFNFPTIDLSVEQRITNNFSITGEGGYEFYHFTNPDTMFIDPKGYKLRAEMRLYHPFTSWGEKKLMHTSLTGTYLGLDFFYRQEQYNSALEFKKAGGDTTVYIDDYWTRKKAGGVNLTFGYQWTPFRRIVADAFLGIGYLHRTVIKHELDYSEKDGDVIATSTRTDTFFANKEMREKSGPGLSLAFGVRIGFVIY
jgi:hypothetical protein